MKKGKRSCNLQCMPETPEQQLKGLLDKFDSSMSELIRECGKVMRKRFPTANELVYDNYNFFVIGYCTTERPSDCVVSLAANSKGLGLSFYHGATLPDPHRILQGSGNQNRFLRHVGVDTLGGRKFWNCLMPRRRKLIRPSSKQVEAS